MSAFQFAVIHIRRYIEISVRMNKRAIAAAGGFAVIIVAGFGITCWVERRPMTEGRWQ
jgi:hypothetical protein